MSPTVDRDPPPPPTESSPPTELTIDQLAQATGMTVRNIRAHQSRGLLPPPEVRGRTGWYGPEHIARLQMIVDMQADGFNLGAIARLLESTPPGTATQTLSFGRSLRERWEDEQSEFMEATELAARVGAGKPEAEWPRVQEALDRLRPLALEAVNATFRRSMERAVDAAAARLLVRQAKPKR